MGLVIDFTYSLQELRQYILYALPAILWALLIILIGKALAVLARKATVDLIRALGVDVIVRRFGLTDQQAEDGSFRRPSFLAGFIVHWAIMFASALYALEVLGLNEATLLLRIFVGYIPNLLVAMVLLALGLSVAGFLGKLASEAARSSRLPQPVWWGKGVQYSVVGFTVTAVLEELGVATSSVLVGFAVLLGVVPVAAALAFGIAGRDQAANILSSTSLRSQVRIGDRIRFVYGGQEISGVVKSLCATSTRISSEDRSFVVPNGVLTQGIIEVIER